MPPTRLGVASLDEASAFLALRPRFFFGRALTTLPLTTLSSTEGLRRPSAASGGKLVWRSGCAEDEMERVEPLRRLRVEGGALVMSPAARFLPMLICDVWYGGEVAVGEWA